MIDEERDERSRLLIVTDGEGDVEHPSDLDRDIDVLLGASEELACRGVTSRRIPTWFSPTARLSVPCLFLLANLFSITSKLGTPAILCFAAFSEFIVIVAVDDDDNEDEDEEADGVAVCVDWKGGMAWIIALLD